MKIKLKSLLPLLFVIALLAVMTFVVNAEECEHNMVHVETVEPGCHYTGIVEHEYCTDCGMICFDGVFYENFPTVLPELGGAVEHVEAVSPTNYTDGNLEYWHCAKCDQYWFDEARTNLGTKDNVVLPKLGHENPFHPVEPEKWYTKAVDYCQKNGYMKGVSDESFGYKQTVTRAMFATILAKIDGAEGLYYTEMSFKDVRPDRWFSSSIEWAYQKGYAAGLGDGVFGYKENVTREQLVTFLYTYSAKNGIDVSGRANITLFSDYDKIHDYARDAMSWAVDAGLITGTGEGIISPRNFATRAELAVIVMNYVENIRCQIRDNYWIKYGLSVSARITGDLMPTFGPTSSLGLTVTLTSDVYEISELPEIEVSARVNAHSGSLELENNTDTLVYKLPVKIIEPGVTDFGSIYSELTSIAMSNSGDAKITVILKIGDEYEWFKITPEISVTH